MIKYMYENYGVTQFHPDKTMADGWTAFHYAAANGFLNTAEYLAKVVKVNIFIVDRFKRSALHWAARFDNGRMVEFLLSLNLRHDGMDIEAKNPLDLAEIHSCPNAIQILQEKKREAYMTDKKNALR